MPRSQRVLIWAGACIIALGVGVATIGPALYRDFFAAPAAEVPTLSLEGDALSSGQDAESPNAAGQGQAGPLNPAALSGAWAITDGSVAGYRVDEVLNGTDVTVTGRTEDVSGTLTIDESGLTLGAAELTVDVASIATDNPSRDNYFTGTAMRASEFPTATFTLTSPVTLEQAPDAGAVVEAEATGDLTIAGVTRSVTAEVQVRSDGSTAEIAGTIPITFADFGVEAPSLGFVQVSESGFVEFQLLAERSG